MNHVNGVGNKQAKLGSLSYWCRFNVKNCRIAQLEQAVRVPDTSLTPSLPVYRNLSLDSGQSSPSKPSTSTAPRRNNTKKLTHPFQDLIHRIFSSNNRNSDKRLGMPTVPPPLECPRKQQSPPEQITKPERKGNYAESSKSLARSPSSQCSPGLPHSPNVPSDFTANNLSPRNVDGLTVTVSTLVLGTMYL